MGPPHKSTHWTELRVRMNGRKMGILESRSGPSEEPVESADVAVQSLRISALINSKSEFCGVGAPGCYLWELKGMEGSELEDP